MIQWLLEEALAGRLEAEQTRAAARREALAYAHTRAQSMLQKASG